MKDKILAYLKASQDHVSGQELCERLGVSRTAVWKVIRQLQEEGYQIEAVRNRGYRLVASGDVYNDSEIRSLLKTRQAGCSLVFLDEVDSTNNEVKRLAEHGAPEGTLVVAELQNAGKGRRGRSWVSPRGSGVWMSFLLRPEFEPYHASMLTLVAAMAVEEAIRVTCGLECGIKWPNDLVSDGRKVSGILTEMSTDVDSIQYVVVGIGINANTDAFPEEIRDTATSLRLCTGKPVNRAALVAAVMEAWEHYYQQFLETLDFRILKDAYNQRLLNRGREVRVLAPKGAYTGISHGINDAGELMVETADGQVNSVMSGEVSVRGIYGYV
ncbi:MAG: biotin--[acetyl-CoA-carboxylase] ligase [Lachnospiraceae bacterium]|nr:biotin--[acetyl-CoA-carboxylase] ligase [Lachnospiraceae bacterium]